MSKVNKNKCAVIGIGSPLLDIVIEIEDDALEKMNFEKGSMNLISKDQSLDIENETKAYKKQIIPGGSSANAISGVNVLGTRAGFMGMIGEDEYGREYKEKTQQEGVVLYLHNHSSDATGHAFTFITPDGERTFATHLGAASGLDKEHIDREEIENAKIFHIEAYQLEDPLVCRAIFHAIAIAKNSDTKISLDLSNRGLVARNKALFEDVIKEHIDIVFANEDEAREFTGKESEEALNDISDMCEIAVVKLGERGSLIKTKDVVYRFKPNKVEVENTNGAGDMYAAGILHGIANDMDFEEAGDIASYVSSLVVASPGARLHEKHIDSVRKYLPKK